MCIQINDHSDPAPPIKAAQITLANPPYLPELPACLAPNARFELETQRLIEAELCLRAATRHVEMAKWSHLDAALHIAEKEISLPFQKLLWADERHTEETEAALLDGEEVEAFTYFIGEIVKARKERRMLSMDADDCRIIAMLLAKYAAAIAESRDGVDDAACADDNDFWKVRQLMMVANADPVRTAE